MSQLVGAGQQRGSALFAALFLLIVVAALGAYAVKLGVNEQHAASLQLLQTRAEAAAMSGLEYASNRAKGGICPYVPPPAPPVTTRINLAAVPEMSSFVVLVTCTPIASGTQQVYELSATAQSTSAYGTPDFVQRTLARRVSNITTPGIW